MDVFERPWRKVSNESLPAVALEAPGWLLPVERKLLWWIGANYWTGTGAIVDAGAFCGASAVAFASGVRASANLSVAMQKNSEVRRRLNGSQSGPIVSFDKFVNADSFEKEFIEMEFGAKLAGGDAFLDYYLGALGSYLDLVRVEVGDFLEKQWNGQPIEVLFLDICKTRALNGHAMGQFISHLIPNHSLVIQQDFMGVWLPHIGWSMEYMSDYFEIIDADCGPSRVYLLKKAVPQELIDDIVSGNIPVDERLRLLDRLRQGSLTRNEPHTAMLAEGMKLQELVLERQLVEHDKMWSQFLEDHSIPGDATEAYFSGDAWVLEKIPNWIPRQILAMREVRLKVS